MLTVAITFGVTCIVIVILILFFMGAKQKETFRFKPGDTLDILNVLKTPNDFMNVLKVISIDESIDAYNVRAQNKKIYACDRETIETQYKVRR